MKETETALSGSSFPNFFSFIMRISAWSETLEFTPRAQCDGDAATWVLIHEFVRYVPQGLVSRVPRTVDPDPIKSRSENSILCYLRV